MFGFSWELYAAAFFGAAIQELAYWFEIRDRLEDGRSRLTIGYWVITVLMILASTIGTLFWFDNHRSSDPRDFIVTAAAFPLIMKRAVSAVAAARGGRRGARAALRGGRSRRSVLAAYFQINE